ncbi:TPA: hypothetical protein SLU74_003204 [Pseudomonas aeruginosa]|uniref:hypothetical protein n=1 Tax=Pseudomonas aeruginosa TaxID=287 RepID=UPI0003B98B71|nr:hypothetical protein [Pseudomonas aeruginosa]HCL2787329.1 hypothetical protein [Pseudomonas aeruginosa 1BAE]EKQ6369259.1 hypothetical protein [Pseudomonas aeruginosa]EKT7985916.1 hypothetical protein [Pseudomonas aeruginosa]EKT8187668.1 hypothetical protein [Pseudomonas aeruginosa]EKU5531502.1 hypothetical protein [Pseudomonas aeruginosa]
MKPCTIGKRHSWTFIRNVVTKHLSGRFVRITKRGIYRCECGAEKYGNAGDLSGGSTHA